jgi:hypothetical protein
MTKNIADNERIFRIISGGLIASMAFWGPENKLALLGLFFVLTGIIGTCPLYYSLGFNSATHREGHSMNRRH